MNRLEEDVLVQALRSPLFYTTVVCFQGSRFIHILGRLFEEIRKWARIVRLIQHVFFARVTRFCVCVGGMCSDANRGKTGIVCTGGKELVRLSRCAFVFQRTTDKVMSSGIGLQNPVDETVSGK